MMVMWAVQICLHGNKYATLVLCLYFWHMPESGIICAQAPKWYTTDYWLWACGCKKKMCQTSHDKKS